MGAVILLLGCCAGMAIGVYVPDQDAEATARGDAFIAKADNPSAVFYNPAGLAQLSGWNVSGTLYGIQMNSKYRGMGSANSSDKIYLLPQFYLGFHPTNRPVSFGVGFYTPFGLGGDYGNNSVLHQVIIKDSLQFTTLSAVTTWEIVPGLSIGAGPVFNFASLNIEQGLAPVNAGDWAKFDGNGNSVGGTAGILWRIKKFSLGAVYRGSSAINYSGSFQVDPGGLPAPAMNEPASMKLNVPNQVGFGLGYHVTTNWQIEADALWTQWSSWGSSTLVKPSGNVTTDYSWSDSWIFSVGTTYVCCPGFKIHAGYGYSQQTVPDSTFTPAIPDSARQVLSLGFTKDFGRHFAGTLAIQQIFGEDRHINNAATLPGTYSFSSTAITTGFVYRF
jgi:long-chain fatty acid transport protein